MGYAEDLAVELHDLWFASKACDEMAVAYSEAKGAVNGCSPSTALDRPDDIGLGTYGESVYDAWSAVQDLIVTSLNTNSTSLSDTAAALRLCIRTYTSTDNDVRTAFNDKKRAIPYE